MKILSVLFACLFFGCATTKIISGDPNAEIYMDDLNIGVGEATVDRVGPYRHVQLEARKGGRVLGKQSMSRSFTFKTVLWGICSYYTGFYWGWYYPESVQIPILAADKDTQKSNSLWSDPGQSVWMRPLK